MPMLIYTIMLYELKKMGSGNYKRENISAEII